MKTNATRPEGNQGSGASLREARELENVKKERDDLLEQLLAVQEQLEALFLGSSEKDAVLVQMKSRNIELEQSLSAAQSELGQAKRALQACENTLSCEVEKSTQLAQQLKTAESRLPPMEALEQEKADLVKQLAAQKSERDTVLSQLHLVQQHLEEIFLERKGLASQVADAKEQVKSKNKKLQKLSQKKREVAEAYSVLEAEVLSLRARVAASDSGSAKKKAGSAAIKLFGRPVRSRSALTPVQKAGIETIKASHLFDARWYLETYEDVRSSGMDPATHFFLHGAEDLRNPGPYFSTEWYLRTYPDVAEAKINPLWHYLTTGAREGRVVKI